MLIISFRMLHIYSVFNEKSQFRAVAIQRLFELCDKNDQITIVIENLKKIEEISNDWELSIEDRRNLFKTCGNILNKNNEA